MNYRDTLNLPKTKFPMRADLVKREPQFLKFWEDNRVYETIRKKSNGKPKYILHDGPPYANGDVHLGTALNKILKDVVVRYKTLRGYDSPYVPGWDCHGLPIEHKVMKSLKDKQESLTQPQVRKKCRAFAEKFVEVQRNQFKRLGVFGDWDRPYLTMNPGYEANIVKVFWALFKEGIVYKALKPVHWCIRCRTALAEAEVEYADRLSPSIYVKFPLEKGSLSVLNLDEPSNEVNVLIWTTTPWTLPANKAVALHPDYEYAVVKTASRGALIMVKDMVESVMNQVGIDKYEITGIIEGRKLENLKYTHPLNGSSCPVILGEEVVKDEGTGCVHTAPGHGEADYELGLKYKLDIFAPVDEQGRFTDGAGDLSGSDVFEANKVITDKLKAEGSLVYENKLTHSYPHCWRCKEPVIFRATEQWFISVDSHGLRDKSMAETEKVNWIPGWGKTRIQSMLTTRPDWCISRQRVWGVPIPVFYCRDCNRELINDKIIKIVEKLFLEEGSDAWFLREAAEILPAEVSCPDCGSKNFRKETDIFDVWFESGVSHQAVLRDNTALSYPADLYLEGSDQHRGWFQTSLLTSVGTEGKVPYKTVLTHGFMVDGEGKKMSKSIGNLISAEEAVTRFGADIIRLWVSSEDYRNDIAFSEEILTRMTEAYRRIRNSCRYILGNINDFDHEKDTVSYDNLVELDKWALSRLAGLVKKATRAYEEFEFHRLYHDLHNFCAVDLSSFYFDILKDRLYTFAADSPERRSAQTVLHKILAIITRLVAPLLPFTAEEIWSYLEQKDENLSSIHLSSWPELPEEYINEELERRWDKLIGIREDVYRTLEKARNEKVIGNSLEAAVTIYSTSPEIHRFLKKRHEELTTIFIVSLVELAEISDCLPAGVIPGEEVKEIGVKVNKASGSKCQRCWNYSETVGKDETHKEICYRCSEVVKTL